MEGLELMEFARNRSWRVEDVGERDTVTALGETGWGMEMGTAAIVADREDGEGRTRREELVVGGRDAFCVLDGAGLA